MNEVNGRRVARRLPTHRAKLCAVSALLLLLYSISFEQQRLLGLFQGLLEIRYIIQVEEEDDAVEISESENNMSLGH